MMEIMALIIFIIVFVLTFALLCHIEYVMWCDWFYGRNSWWNILYKNR